MYKKNYISNRIYEYLYINILTLVGFPCVLQFFTLRHRIQEQIDFPSTIWTLRSSVTTTRSKMVHNSLFSMLIIKLWQNCSRLFLYLRFQVEQIFPQNVTSSFLFATCLSVLCELMFPYSLCVFITIMGYYWVSQFF